MKGNSEDCEKLDIAMQALWHLGIIAVHGTGSRRGDGIRECRSIYEDAGGPESGYLGFCYYGRADADAAEHTRSLDFFCGDFLDKSLVTRGIRDVVKDALRRAGLDAGASRGSPNRITLRSFDATRHGLPPPPPLHVTPQPPQELIAATTAVPAASAPRRRSILSSDAMPPSPLDNLTRIALGIGAPPPIPDVPGAPTSDSDRWSPGTPRNRSRQAVKLVPAAKLPVGIASIVVGLALIGSLWGTPRFRVGGVVLSVLGAVLVVLGRKQPKRPAKESARRS